MEHQVSSRRSCDKREIANKPLKYRTFDYYTRLNSDLAQIIELGRSDVCDHQRVHWMVVDQVCDPE